MSYTMISNEEYHSRDELSASQIKKLLDNPYEFLHPQEVNGKNLDIGSALHKLVLERDSLAQRRVCMQLLWNARR